MTRRRSIGRDPLDWIGEPGGASGGPAPSAVPGPSTARNGSDDAPEALDGAEALRAPAGAPAAPGPVLSLTAPATAFQLERQLLLWDGVLREGSRRPRLNRALWALLVLLFLAAGGILALRESSRQWGARVASLEGTIERIEEEKGRNERMLVQVIGEKDDLIREKQSTIARMEAIHQGALEELQYARAESRRLHSENQTLSARVALREREPAPAAADGPAGTEHVPDSPGGTGPPEEDRADSPEGKATPREG